MDQGIGMKAFDRSGDVQRTVCLWHPAGKARGRHHKGRRRLPPFIVA